MKEIVFATSNAHKLAEVREILSDKYMVLGLSDIGWTEEIAEPYMTLKENALHKAQTIYEAKGIMCFAEDTGLEVSALDNAPGVFTARYAGPQKDTDDNINLLLKNLNGINDRSAQFRSIVCIYDGTAIVIEGILKGEILNKRQGLGGFGYDPIFKPHGYDLSLAQLDANIKNQISHRGLAIRDMAELLMT